MKVIPELWATVMDKYPKLDRERTCRLERGMRNEARMSYYNKLLNESQRAQDILEEGNKGTVKVPG